MLCLCFRHCCCGRKPYGYSRAAYAVSLILLLLFTTATITGVGFLYAGQAKFQNSIVNILSYILHQADTVVVNLQNLLSNLEAAKSVGVGQITLPDEIKGEIDTMAITINQLADTFHNVTGKNSHDIRNFLDPLRLAVIYVAAAVLVLAFLGFLFSILGKKWVVYCLVIAGWILVAGTFIISGMFLLVHNVVADTCVAMDEWHQNPNANSALEEIIPRVDNTTAQDISKVTKGVTFSLLSVVNYAITNVSNANNLPPEAKPLYFNQSGILMPTYCNPYNPDFTDRKCEPGEVNFTNASQVWKKYICDVSSSDICITTGRLTPDRYTQLTSSVNVSYGLYTGMPFVVELIDSTFLTETFTDISENNCPGLRKYTKWVYVGFITSSAALMFSLIFWVVYVRERRHRGYTKRVDRQPEEEASYIQG
ncbi:transmembrane DDB_G0292058 [Olea europaea subsp. europaea]|uniref:Transmembrane DDB_G0292058 n=1 Tax=Olea europaea subsp. europaea TaxID=158383 RepID=A0A8S0Q3H7_OLEEU|nr:transmembrane DDB_G0292058 [Olea europaea subsp. europaea]